MAYKGRMAACEGNLYSYFISLIALDSKKVSVSTIQVLMLFIVYFTAE